LQVLAYIGKGYPKAGEPEGQPDQGELGISWGGKVGGGRGGVTWRLPRFNFAWHTQIRQFVSSGEYN